MMPRAATGFFSPSQGICVCEEQTCNAAKGAGLLLFSLEGNQSPQGSEIPTENSHGRLRISLPPTGCRMWVGREQWVTKCTKRPSFGLCRGYRLFHWTELSLQHKFREKPPWLVLIPHYTPETLGYELLTAVNAGALPGHGTVKTRTARCTHNTLINNNDWAGTIKQPHSWSQDPGQLQPFLTHSHKQYSGIFQEWIIRAVTPPNLAAIWSSNKC